MAGYKKSLTGRMMRLEMGSADGRDQREQIKDTTPAQKFQDFEQCLADAFVMSRDFPRRMRFSWIVDRNGKLRPLSNREVPR